MKILILIDRLNWAYHSIANGLMKYNPYDDVELETMHIKHNVEAIKARYKKYDRYLVMGWQNYTDVAFIPKHKTMVGIHGHHAWDNRKTTPDNDVEPPDELVMLLNKFKAVNAVSQRLAVLFGSAGVKKVAFTPNGVDTEVFKPGPGRNGRPFTVGCACTHKHDWRKGVNEFITPACKEAGVELKVAWQDRKPEEMPKFYHEIDSYVCASSSEGMSISVLEAIASGLPIITTNVGDNWNHGGVYYVDRNVDHITMTLRQLDGLQSVLAIGDPKQFSWKTRARAWIDFLIS